MSEQPPDRGADTAAGLPLGYYQNQSERALRRWYDAQSGQQSQPPPVRQEPHLPYRQQQSYGQPRQPSFTPDPQYGTPSGRPPYRETPHEQPYVHARPSGQQPGPAPRRPARKSWPQRHKVLTVLGSLTALIIVIAGIASASGKARQADNASAVATTTPTRTATPSRAPTHHATSTGTVPTVTAQATTLAPVATTPAPAATTRAPVSTAAKPTATAHAAAPPPPPATAPAGCSPLTNGGNCYEPGEYCRDADHGASGVAGDGKAITCEYNDGWRWEAS